MKLLTESDQLSAGEKVRRLYRSKEELAIRDALERVCRLRWPEARLVHELVMGRGSVRADLAAVAPNHLAAFEITLRITCSMRERSAITSVSPGSTSTRNSIWRSW